MNVWHNNLHLDWLNTSQTIYSHALHTVFHTKLTYYSIYVPFVSIFLMCPHYIHHTLSLSLPNEKLCFILY